MRRLTAVVLALLFCSPAIAQNRNALPDAPKPKPVLDKKFYFVIGALAASKAADAFGTVQSQGAGCIETNPILGPRPSAGRIAGYFATQIAAEAGAAYLLKRYGQHHRWARFFWLIEPTYQTAYHARLAAKGLSLNCHQRDSVPPIVLIGPIR